MSFRNLALAGLIGLTGCAGNSSKTVNLPEEVLFQISASTERDYWIAAGAVHGVYDILNKQGCFENRADDWRKITEDKLRRIRIGPLKENYKLVEELSIFLVGEARAHGVEFREYSDTLAFIHRMSDVEDPELKPAEYVKRLEMINKLSDFSNAREN